MLSKRFRDSLLGTSVVEDEVHVVGECWLGAVKYSEETMVVVELCELSELSGLDRLEAVSIGEKPQKGLELVELLSHSDGMGVL